MDTHEGRKPESAQALFPEVPVGNEGQERYYADAIEKIKRGETVWMQRNFDSDTGRVLDLFSEKQYRGYIEQEYDDMACDVYIIEGDEAEAQPKRLNHRRVSPEYGASMLLTAVRMGPVQPSRPGFGYRGH